MSFGEYFQAFGSLGDAYREGQDRRDQKKWAEDAAALSGKQLDLYLQQQGVGVPGAVQPGGLAPLGQISTPRLPTFADASGAGGDYLSNLYRRESGNNPNARPSTSGAAGLGQFIPGTWNAVAGAHPELGLTPYVKGQPDPRLDEKQMDRATKALTADNEVVLANKGLPVTDASRYALHFLGAGAGPKLVAGALSNPNAPATAFAGAAAVNANRPVFFNKDGSPKTAGQVMSDFQRSFGGGGRTQVAQAPVAVPTFGARGVDTADAGPAMQMPGVIANPPMPPQRPVQLASADPDNVPMPAAPVRPMQLPSGAPGASPAVAGPPANVADAANMPAPNAVPAGFQIPPGSTPQTLPQQTVETPAEAPFVPGQQVSPAIQAGRSPDLPSLQGQPRISPQQAAFLRAELANPLLRAKAMEQIQALGAPDKWEVKELNGRVVQTNARGDIRAVPGFDKPDELEYIQGKDGSLLIGNKKTGAVFQARPPAPEKADTNDIANYNFAVRNGYQGDFNTWFTNVKKAAASTVSIDQKGETAFETTANTKLADRFVKLSEEGDAARTDSALLGQLKDLGTVNSTGALAAAQGFLANKGIKLGDNVGAVEAYQAIVDKLVPAQRIPGSGTTSDFDAKGFKNALPSLMRTPDGNQLIIGTLTALNDDKMARAQIAEQALTKQITPQQALQNLRSLPPPNLYFRSGMAELAKSGKLGPAAAENAEARGVQSQPRQDAPKAQKAPASLVNEVRARMRQYNYTKEEAAAAFRGMGYEPPADF